MSRRKLGLLLVVAAACGSWLLLSSKSTQAAGGGRPVQVTVVNSSGALLSDARVEVMHPGGKSVPAIHADKQTWLVKEAGEKLSLNVRSGRMGGIVDVSIPQQGDSLVKLVITVGANGLRAEVAEGDSLAPTSSIKPDLQSRPIHQSLRATFSEANRPAGPIKGQPVPQNKSTNVKGSLRVPGNDLCANAVSVSVPSVTSGTTVDATADAAGTCGVTDTAPGVWYTFTGTGTVVTASLCTGTNYDSKISVFSGSCGSLTCVGGNDDGCSPYSTLTFCSTAGTTYLVLVHGFSSATGAFDLTVSSGASCGPPPNDLCSNAIAIGSLPTSVTVDNTFATNDTLLTCGSTPQNNTTWYTIVGDGTTYTASTCNAVTAVSDTELVVYCGDCATPLCIGGDDDGCPGTPPGTLKSVFNWCTQAGATYLIAVGNFSGGGTVQLDVSSSGSACSGAVSCLTITGACCNTGTCTGTTDQATCEGGGGVWHIGETCPAFACPGVCVGDTCASAALISALPFNGTGNSCDCTNDYDSVCPFTGGTAPDVVYTYTPTQDECVDISLCNGSDYDTKLYVFENTCGGSAIACNDDSCSSPNFPTGPYVSSLSTVHLTGGNTYYIVVDGYGTNCGHYVLDVTPVACPAPCGVCQGGTPENEADCGLPTDTVDGGCNSSPNVFKPIACGETVCGTAAWDGTNRDTDWYEVTVAVPTAFTFSASANFDAVIGKVNTSDCATATAIDPFAAGLACQDLSVTTVCLQPGTYWFIVVPDFNGPTFACGATYTATLSCDATCVPPTCQGETCDTAEVIPSSPFSGTGDTCLCGDDYDEVCPYTGIGAPDKVYKYTPAQDECVDISLCAGSAYDTKVYVYQGTCGPYEGGTQIACNDDNCSSPTVADFVSSISGLNLIAGQTYYFVVDGYADDFEGPQCGVYTFDMVPCAPPCDVTCAPNDTPENEADCGLGPQGDTVNGGCNSDTVNPPVSVLACGQEYCGTSAFDGVTRDTDWYEVTTNSAMYFTWTVDGEFDSLMGLVETVPAGSPNCADGTGFINPAGFPLACQPGVVTTECQPAGTYRFFVAPLFGDLVPCGKEYTARLDCTPCIIPLGACCRGNGSCDDGIAESQCQSPDTWQGDATQCMNVSCPQPPPNDDCADAIGPLAVPSSTAGTTALASLDPGLPATCGTSITTPGVWYSVLGTGNTMTASLCNAATGYDTKISVFCPDCGTPVCVGGNDDFCGLQSQVSWCSAAGQNYLILVHGFGGATGPFQLDISDDGAACPVPASCVPVPDCPGVGDCCDPAGNGGIGCNDTECCETVCAFDPYCCGHDPTFGGFWDSFCAGEAATLCAVCAPTPSTGACCQGFNCSVLTAADCATAGGHYLGDGTDCSGAGAGNPTNYDSDVGVAIPDGGGPGNAVTHTIMVPDSFTIGDVDVDVRVTHTWVGDLTVTVEHLGTTVTIIDQMGVPASSFGCSSNDLNVVLDDEGTGGAIEGLCGATTDDPVPTSPPNYTPNQSLSAFNGMNSAGAWTITVWDNASSDTGTLDHWSLHIDQPGPSPCIPTGACCTSTSACQITTQAACTGIYLGDDTSCFVPGPVSNYQSNVSIAIPDGGGPGNAATDTINVPDSFTMADVDIDLGITHTWIGDLIVTVEHNGTSVTIVDQPGVPASSFGCSSNDLSIVLDDEGTGGAIESLCGATTDSPTPTSPPNYAPNNPLSAFDGMNSAGAWNINVSDNASADTGTLMQWSLHIQRAGPSACGNLCFPDCTGRVCGDDGCGGSCGTCPSDGLSCTVDSCNAAGQCEYTPNNAACDNHLACDGVETCSLQGPAPTGCIPGTPVICDDHLSCTVDACNEPNGNCTHTPNNAACDNGLACDGVETCSTSGLAPTGCVDGTDVDCNDQVDCTVDACNEPAGNCTHDDSACFTPIPTVSQWGLAVLALVLLIGAKLYFGRRSATA